MIFNEKRFEDLKAILKGSGTSLKFANPDTISEPNLKEYHQLRILKIEIGKKKAIELKNREEKYLDNLQNKSAMVDVATAQVMTEAPNMYVQMLKRLMKIATDSNSEVNSIKAAYQFVQMTNLKASHQEAVAIKDQDESTIDKSLAAAGYTVTKEKDPSEMTDKEIDEELNNEKSNK